MRIDLDHLPGRKQQELERALAIAQNEFQDALALGTSAWKREAAIHSIILFGSYARGDWVDERHTGKGYQSDYDLLIIVNHKKLVEHYELWDRLWDRLYWDRGINTPVNFIVHTLEEVNCALAEGRYFFVDIYREGIELLGNKGTKLRSPRKLSAQTALDMAEEYAGFWISCAKASLKMAHLAIGENELSEAAFNLHQATERAYNALLLTLTNYTPSTHNINALRSRAEGLDQTLIDAWPRTTKAETAPFNKLVDAYVKARYSSRFRIDRETLDRQIAGIERLHALVELACEARLVELQGNVED